MLFFIYFHMLYFLVMMKAKEIIMVIMLIVKMFTIELFGWDWWRLVLLYSSTSLRSL